MPEAILSQNGKLEVPHKPGLTQLDLFAEPVPVRKDEAVHDSLSLAKTHETSLFSGNRDISQTEVPRLSPMERKYPDANGFVPPDVLTSVFPDVASAEALHVTDMNGYAARALMAFQTLVVQYAAMDCDPNGSLLIRKHLVRNMRGAATEVNAIARGVASERPVPTVESCRVAAESIRDYHAEMVAKLHGGKL